MDTKGHEKFKLFILDNIFSSKQFNKNQIQDFNENKNISARSFFNDFINRMFD
jgi:hypothetical protein